MSFIADRWRRIGTRLYLVLGIAVLLTLISSAVGVLYFERSGDLNYEVESQSVPALEASWDVAREAERLRALGLELMAAESVGAGTTASGAVEDSLARLEDSLTRASAVRSLESQVLAVQDAAYDVVGAIDGLEVNRAAALQADASVAALRVRMESIPANTETSVAGLRLLGRALRAESQGELDVMWNEFVALSQSGLEPEIAEIGGGEGVFAVRGQQIALRNQELALAASFADASNTLGAITSALLDGARSNSNEALGLSVQSFDQGRVLLAVISIVSVVAATLAAWLWVGNAIVRRLSRLSERMRNMARGDLQTPVPEVGRDEIGQLADALEHFRQQALEVQRLNLVEKLYGELREANDELQRMQARLVAQEKLAALGELVSGVAHEISNPLNFVKNFSEGSLDLYSELTEMLQNYRDRMTDDDASLLDELSEELTNSLNRVSYNGGRALAIVERMRGLNVEAGPLVPVAVNETISQAAQTGCEVYMKEWEDFKVELKLDLDPTVGDVPIVEGDFADALVNLVSNACFAMHQRKAWEGDEYQPILTVSSRRSDGMVDVRVRDNGPGIEDEVVGRIFNPFFTTREGTMGAGLGLPIAADVARRLGGELVVDTVYGEYAEFTMHIPAPDEEEDAGDTLADEVAAAMSHSS